ncbi:rCG36279, isoform CRA_b [Rattus norvegicus]|uniref:RCG36279, isoform CRA_b n=1 Tax=Rattus norvegicus TaxID=10116 RepID=A6IQ26_RAT|nr:rCG36279, isoform CRA_b [Rattus norvegicus]
MNLMDIAKIFSLLQPEKEEEDADTGEKQALNQAVYDNDSCTLDHLLHQERYKRFINSRSGWATPRSLLSQARLVIRRSLCRANQPQAIDQLDIPPVLISYLKHQ